METLVKALELGAKYALAVFIVSVFVISIPDEVATQLDLLNLRKNNFGYFVIVSLFSGAMAISGSGEIIWRYLMCPFRKIVFPLKDFRSNIKQSRFRYYSVQFNYKNGDRPIYFLAVTSNGVTAGFFDKNGKRILPEEPSNVYVHLEDGKFQPLKWGKVDWQDVFNGDMTTGHWGIVEP